MDASINETFLEILEAQAPLEKLASDAINEYVRAKIREAIERKPIMDAFWSAFREDTKSDKPEA